jgi:DMSO reductase anchor subunit
MAADLNSATGLAGGTVRSIEWPHTEQNYLLKEMGFRVARKHQQKLRAFVQLAAFAIPAGLLLVDLVLGGGALMPLAVLAVASQLSGLLVERWLFFAEAKHTIQLYYGLA